MGLKFYQDNFDTNILREAVYKLNMDNEIEEDELTQLLEKVKSGIIFTFTIFINKNINLLQKYGFDLISIRTFYKLDLDSYTKKLIKSISSKYKFLNKSQAIKVIKEENLIQLAETIYKTSRYSKDRLINKKDGLKIYTNWIKNSLFENYADEVFLVFDNSFAVGLITIKIKKAKGFIDLLGVIDDYQNRKLATHLLKKAVNFLISEKIEKIYVITEGENIKANIFYQKNNFMPDNLELVYHKHIKENL